MSAKKTPPSDGGGVSFRHLGLWAVGTHIVVAVAIGFFIGYNLDKWLGTTPWLMLLFVVFGSIAGVLNVFREVRRYNDEDDDSGGA
jgi:ATP synthase protein I